jgi:hypothetical protein
LIKDGRADLLARERAAFEEGLQHTLETMVKKFSMDDTTK